VPILAVFQQKFSKNGCWKSEIYVCSYTLSFFVLFSQKNCGSLTFV
jgi:hypothetical protein